MSNKSCCTYLLLLALLLGAFSLLCSAQYYPQYVTYNPYYNTNPTFSNLDNPYNYYYNSYTTPYPYSNTKIRIWPYVIGQYLYPSYYNNYNNPWQNYYSNGYTANWGRK